MDFRSSANIGRCAIGAMSAFLLPPPPPPWCVMRDACCELSCRASPRADGARSSERAPSVPCVGLEFDRDERTQFRVAPSAFRTRKPAVRMRVGPDARSAGAVHPQQRPRPPSGPEARDRFFKPLVFVAAGHLAQQRLDWIAGPLAGARRLSMPDGKTPAGCATHLPVALRRG